MADFKTHMAASTLVGVAYGYIGLDRYGLSVETCLLAGGLCSISGMLPDLDSDSGVPIREATSLAAAIVPMLMSDRLHAMQLTPEAMVLAAAAIYLTIRFLIAELFRRFTIHRGMWHSIPACASAGLIAYLMMHGQNDLARTYKSLAVVAGFLVHLLLDELWSVVFKEGRFQLKSSFGSAFKFWGPKGSTNLIVYGKTFLLAWLAHHDYVIWHRPEQLPIDRPSWQIPFTAESTAPSPAPRSNELR